MSKRNTIRTLAARVIRTFAPPSRAFAHPVPTWV